MKHKSSDSELSVLIREHGLRSTPARVRLLQVLAGERFPMRIKDLKMQIGASINTVTVYRNVEAFVRVGLVDRLDFGEDVASYEFRHPGEDHHHVTCVLCKKRANVSACVPNVVARALREAKGFASIDRHSLEFFGTCSDCAKNAKKKKSARGAVGQRKRPA